MPAAAVEVMAWFAVLSAMAVVCVGPLSPVELTVGALAALGGAFAARRVRLAAGVGWGGGRGAPRAVLMLPAAVVGGIAALLTTLAHRRGSGSRRLRRVRLRDGCDAGWSAAAMAFSPDTCVLGIPRDDEVLLHSLRARPGPVERAVSRAEDSS
ncbi:hypothetical protein [Streptomyces sp. NPDC086787]|uniref:hypothetical protein n=1 Tax=Streptomyces sp. NPDC086787 TaxID=3365759 RepID=UPI0038040939